MDDFEQQLKQALGRKDPPAWFEARVLSAAAREPRRKSGWWAGLAGRGRLHWAAAVFATLLVVTGIAWQRERAAEERAAGEAARAKLEVALRITSAKLQHIEQRVIASQKDQ